ncbi:MAG: FadR/GntR family transcriptional regulator [Lachnospirales bacterium]
MAYDKFTISKTNLYEQIADRLEGHILKEGYSENNKLPSEQTLADNFSVSRNVVRESLKVLKERGLIESKNGAGTYVRKPEPSNLSDVINRMFFLENMDMTDVYDVRIILEAAACKHATTRITNDELKVMEEILNKLLDESLSVEERRELDFDFHVAIAAASGNALLCVLIQAMKNIFIEMIEKGIFIEGGIDDARARHENIFEALKERNGVVAEAMMIDHLHYSKKNVEKFYENLKK